MKLAHNWYSDLNRRVRRNVEQRRILERDETGYEINKQWEEEFNSDSNRRVRRNVEQRQVLKNDYENERNIAIARKKARKADNEEHDRLIRLAKIQIGRDERKYRRNRLNRKARMKVENDTQFYLQTSIIKKNLFKEFNDNE